MVAPFFVLMLGGLGWLSLWYLTGAVLSLWALVPLLLVLPGALWHDRRRASERRLSHPDCNYWELPLLNAIGFSERGAPLLPGTKEAKRWLKTHRPLRALTPDEMEATRRA